MPHVQQHAGRQILLTHYHDFPATRRELRRPVYTVSGHHDHYQVPTSFDHDPRCFKSVEARHVHVHEHEIRTQRCDRGDRLPATSSLADMAEPRRGGDEFAQYFAKDALVIGAEHPDHALLIRTH